MILTRECLDWMAHCVFLPSNSPKPTDGNTLLLLHGDGSGNLGNLITDDSYTTGKQTQLHGWAVNY